jgi:hypothetical protein
MKKLFILADLGRVRVLESKQDSELAGGRRHLAEVTSAAFERPTQSLGEVVTDQAGRFGQGGPAGSAGGMSYGEEHELENERERQALVAIAGHIDRVAAEAGPITIVLAAPKSVLKRLEAALADATRQSIRETIPADLTKESLKDLEDRFVG